ERGVAGASRDLGRVASPNPRDVSGTLQALASLLGRVRDAAPYAVPAAIIAAGLAAGASGLWLLRRAEWARFATAGVIGAALLGATWAASPPNADPAVAFALWRPLVVTGGAVLGGKLLFDLLSERFELRTA